MFKKRRKLLSQNFFIDRKLVNKLLRRTSIGRNDLVLDIGAGGGVITQELVRVAGRVFAVEVDKKLATSLSNKFRFEKDVVVLNKDFRDIYLPDKGYKVFSNIPFIITSSVVKELIFANNPPTDAYLIVQKEAANKYIFNPKRNSQISMLIHPFFEIKIIHQFKRSNFFPEPRVDSVLIHIHKRKILLIDQALKKDYQDLVVYIFNQTKSNIIESLRDMFGKDETLTLIKRIGFRANSIPSELSPDHWIRLFECYIEHGDQRKVNAAFQKQFYHQQKLQKIHRTRKDKNWKSY